MSQINRADEIYAAVICLTFAIFGIITNGAAIILIAFAKNLQNAFGYSCMSHAIGDLGVLFIFSTWVPFQLFTTPESIPEFLQNKRLAYTIGQATITFYYAAIYTHVLIGINRFIAIAKPFSYGFYFSDKRTRTWIMLIWFISFIQSCIYQFDGCHYFFDRNAMLFVYSDGLCAQITSIYWEFYVNLGFVILVVAMDTMTFFKLKKMVKSANNSIEEVYRRRKKQEIRYFIQSVCSETTLILSFICFWSSAGFVNKPFHLFLLNTGAWICMHAMDGLIMTAFNHQFITRLRIRARTNPIPLATIFLTRIAVKKVNKQRSVARKRWFRAFPDSTLKTNRIEPDKTINL